MKKERILYALIAILIVTNVFTAASYHFSLEVKKKSAEEIKDKVKKYLELSYPNSIIEISAVTEENGLYKVIFKINGNLGEIYITRDGNYLMQNPVSVDELISNLEKVKNFIECLKSKGVKFYGIANCTYCKLQRQILGAYYYEIYVPCDIYPEICSEKNITAVPAFEIDGTIRYGLMSLDDLSKLTGCSLE